MIGKLKNWLLPLVLILFVVQVLVFPLMAGYTFAGTSRAPDQILTYTKGSLTWDSNVNILPDGAAQMELFFPEYDDSVLSGNGDKIIAPGTGEDNTVRLHNAASGPVTYTAVLYTLESDPAIPVKTTLSGQDLAPVTADFPLPDDVPPAQVVQAVTGTLDANQIQDLTVDWDWHFYLSEGADILDTSLGNKQPLDTLTVGLYIVVEDDNSYVTPDVPDTGDYNQYGMYFALMGISLVVMILLIFDRRRDQKNRENPEIHP